MEPKSKTLYEKGLSLISGGVNSPVRAFKPYPFFVSHAEGSKLYDVDENVYIDYCLGYGPLILGHAYPEVVEAIAQQLKRGTLYGAPTEMEVELAELIAKLVPSIEMVRLVNTGTEATMSAVRVARAYTGREKIVKFDGCYHGAYDYVLVKARSGATALGIPISLGVPAGTTKSTLVVPFNDIDSLEQVMLVEGDHIAAVIVEPIMGNAGLIPPRDGYLKTLGELTDQYGIVLIFDEIITGFRLALGGAQEYYGVVPDMTTLGKILGGGLPIGAFGGKREIMELVAPSGKVYQAGTFSGNPISVTSGLTTLTVLMRNRGIYDRLSALREVITKALRDAAEDAGVLTQVNEIASMFQIFFTDQPVVDYTSARTSKIERFTQYHRELLRLGIFVPPSQFETCFLSTVHTKEDIDNTVEAIGEAVASLSQ